MRFLLVSLFSFALSGCVSLNPDVEGEFTPQALIPLEERPFVAGWVDGKEVELAVDTGASQATLLFSETVKLLGGSIHGKGALSTTNLDVIVYDGQEPEDDQTVAEVSSSAFAGLIGWPMIKKFVWNIDYPEKEHRFVQSVPFWVRNTFRSMTLITRDNLPHICDAYGTRIVIDTGAPYGIYLSKKKWQEWKEQNPDAFITLYDGFSPAAGGAYAKECARAESFMVNGIEFGNILIAETFIDDKIMKLDQQIDILIGLDAFKYRKVWFDGENEKIYFGFHESIEYDDIPINLVGVCFLPRTEGRLPYEVVVLKNSIAWKAGLRTGDKLISLNGHRHPSQDVFNLLTKNPGSKATAMIWRNGSVKKFLWTVPSEEEVQPPETPYAGENMLPAQNTTGSPEGNLSIPVNSPLPAGSVMESISTPLDPNLKSVSI